MRTVRIMFKMTILRVKMVCSVSFRYKLKLVTEGEIVMD